ncbi:MAG TPA: long-chain fatty acid--CoA ligase [Longimicrobiales bacterium]|nr:long-chain fatty acid--CoA ligase [Longimicrobiales bacterium]
METEQQTAAAGGSADYAAHPAELPHGTLVDLFFEAVGHDKRDAQLRATPAGWQPIAHREFYDDVRRLAAGLRALGLARGDRCALLAENRPEWALADYAALCIGALTVPLYPSLTAAQAGYILRHSGATIAFASTRAQLAKLEEARPLAPELRTIIVFDEVEDGNTGTLALPHVLELGGRQRTPDADFRAEAQRARPDDTATVIYTSGTTGDPKGVMLTHDNLYTNVRASLMEALEVSPADIALSFLPLSHVLQRMVDYALFSAGASIAYVPAIEQVPAALVQVRPTIAVSVPRLYEKTYAKVLSATGVKRSLVVWARHVAMAWSEATEAGGRPAPLLALQHRLADRLVFRKVRAAMGGRIRFFVSGGAPLSPTVARFFHGARVTILEGYGLTETSPVTNVNTPRDFRIGTVGKPVPGTEIRIAADGEILVRGPQVMKGYFRNEAATREAITEDGWFHTGDIGALDADGFLRITDRKKDLLVTAGGKNIAPQPIQNAAKTSRFVSEAVLIGDRRPYAIIIVVPNFENLRTWARLHDVPGDVEELVRNERVQARVLEDIESRLAEFARFEKPKKILLLPRDLTLERGEITPSLKIRRQVVEEHFAAELEALYAQPAPDARNGG